MMTQPEANPAELEKFDELAKDWWDKNGPLKTLHAINVPRLSFIKSHTELVDKEVLDIGCGGGILTEALAREGANTTGIDLAKKTIDIARKHANKENLTIDYQVVSAESWANDNEARYDVITCMELLEHVPDPEKVITTIDTLLKPQGKVFLSTLNRTIMSFLQAIVGAEYILNIIPRGTHSYQQFIKPAELATWCRAHNLTVNDIQGLNYNPVNNNAKLTKNIHINYLMCCQK